MLRTLSILVAVALVGSFAHAGGDDQKAKAIRLFGDADKLYKTGDFEQAAKLLEEAYALYPEPLLLYNLARALEGMGSTQGAIDAYERYLAQAAKIEDRGAIERRVATLKVQLAARGPAQPAPVVVDPMPPVALKLSDPFGGPPVQEARPHRSALPFVTIGVGAGALITGFVFGKLSADRHDSAVAASSQVDAQRLDDSAHGFATTANVMFIAGGAIVVAGVVWEILDHKRVHRQPLVGLAVGRSTLGIAGTW